MFGSNGWGIAMIPTGLFLAAAVDRLADSLKDTRKPMERAVREVMMPSIDKNFQVGGRPAWEGYSPNTRNSTAIRMLEDTGALRGAAASFSIWTITEAAAMATLPYGVRYGAPHQFGAPRANLPQREYVVMQPEDADAIEEIFHDWMGKTAMKSGLIG